MDENWKSAHALRAHVRKAEPALRQTDIEHRQLVSRSADSFAKSIDLGED